MSILRVKIFLSRILPSMRHVLLLMLLFCLLWGCTDKRAEGAKEPKKTSILGQSRTASPSPTPLDPAQKTLDLCVGNDVVSYRLSDMGVMVGSAGGLVIDESWKENDGLVNTISARAPSSAPAQAFDKEKIVPGVWNIMPTYHGDHMSLQGGLMKKNDVKDFYMDLLQLIAAL